MDTRYTGPREWRVCGRYEYWAVDEFRPDEPGNAVYDTVECFRVKRLAERVASALNSAFMAGRNYETSLL